MIKCFQHKCIDKLQCKRYLVVKGNYCGNWYHDKLKECEHYVEIMNCGFEIGDRVRAKFPEFGDDYWIFDGEDVKADWIRLRRSVWSDYTECFPYHHHIYYKKIKFWEIILVRILNFFDMH